MYTLFWISVLLAVLFCRVAILFLQRYTTGIGDRVTWFCPFSVVSIEDIMIYKKSQINILKVVKTSGLKFSKLTEKILTSNTLD